MAGLLGIAVDDSRVPFSFEIAEQEGLEFHITGIDLGDAHPNTVKLNLTGESGKKIEIIAASIGGGQIEVCEIDGLSASFGGNYPTIIVNHKDIPGRVTAVTSRLSESNVNIATMKLYRTVRGGDAVMIIECDHEVPVETVKSLEELEGIIKVTYLSLQE